VFVFVKQFDFDYYHGIVMVLCLAVKSVSTHSVFQMIDRIPTLIWTVQAHSTMLMKNLASTKIVKIEFNANLDLAY